MTVTPTNTSSPNKPTSGLCGCRWVFRTSCVTATPRTPTSLRRPRPSVILKSTLATFRNLALSTRSNRHLVTDADLDDTAGVLVKAKHLQEIQNLCPLL